MPRIFITRQIPEKGLAILRPHCEISLWDDELPPPYETLKDRVRGMDGLLCLLTDRIDGDLMDAAPDLRVISNLAVGYDNIDVDAATQRGIPVGNTPGVLTETSADLAFALMCAGMRRLPEAERYVKAGKWRTWHPLTLLGHDLHGATLGIIGLGRIGQAVAKRARGFDMRLLYHGGSDTEAATQLGAERVALDVLLRQSDIVSIHAPLTDETRGMIGAEQLSQMKKGALLVNTARGPIVQTDALVAALQSGRIRAALDVTDPEPLPADHPLLTLDNCLVVPHIGSSTIHTRERMATIAAENLLAGLRGEKLPHCVNPSIYAD